MAESSIETRLADELKQSMRQRDSARVACIRQVRSKVQEAVNAPGFSDEVDDAFYQKIIASYVKQLRRGIEELGNAGGERGEALKQSYGAEITYLEQYLPRLLDEAATRAIVEETVAALGVSGTAQLGRVMGTIMKEHKGEVDPALVRKVLEDVLGG